MSQSFDHSISNFFLLCNHISLNERKYDFEGGKPVAMVKVTLCDFSG